MGDERKRKRKISDDPISRRKLLKLTGKVALAAGALPNLIWLDNAVAAIPASEGYLLVDTKKCQGCLSCMLACSLVHEGTENLSLARIQILQNSFAKFPDDLAILGILYLISCSSRNENEGQVLEQHICRFIDVYEGHRGKS